MSKQGTVNRPALAAAAAMVVPARVVGETAIAMVVVTVKVLVSGFGTLVTLRVTPTMFAAVMMAAILLVKPVAPSDTMTLVTEAAVMVVLPSGMVISYAAFTASARRRASSPEARRREGHDRATVTLLASTPDKLAMPGATAPLTPAVPVNAVQFATSMAMVPTTLVTVLLVAVAVGDAPALVVGETAIAMVVVAVGDAPGLVVAATAFAMVVVAVGDAPGLEVAETAP
ncbi:unnamed protein product, partial [Polarella glacialis]